MTTEAVPVRAEGVTVSGALLPDVRSSGFRWAAYCPLCGSLLGFHDKKDEAERDSLNAATENEHHAKTYCERIIAQQKKGGKT